MVSETSTGFTKGTTTERNSRFSPQPSMRAASMSSSGTLTMNCRTRNTPNAFRMGSISAMWVFISPRFLMMVNTGMSVTCPGIINVAR